MTMTEPPEPSATIQPLKLQEEEIDLSDLHWTDTGVLALFWLLAFVVFLQFFTRYVLNNSFAWTEEVARFLLIGVTFVGCIMATRKQSHIAVEFVYRWIPRGGRRFAQSVIDVTSTAFYLVMAFLSAQIAGRTQQMMASMDFPKSTVYWIIMAAFLCMAAYAAWNTWQHLRSGTSRLIDPEDYADDIRAID
ncbi:TRAP transporter small permease [Szabonella alba]|uniref:TRAP transporter small permease protein n=1 Tax=Szabonella alba TaxID=2804194 RepID=A0A8K0Y226_9RHOB|nr:TRAP transporter small permease [Szabonella alba]MBL4916759.1 TRAP transporter small permease [Szabonella alba]